MLNFVIPIRHPQSIANWAVIKKLLAQTFASLAAQQGGAWRAIVVANPGTDLPALPPRFELVTVDIPLNELPDIADDKEAFYNAVRDDKGARIFAGIDAAKPSGHIMVVDYDDLVSRRLAAMVAANPTAPGWYVQSGYKFDGGRVVSGLENFNDVCGTSLIVRADLLERAGDDTHHDHVRYVLGSHRFIRQRLAARSTPLAPIAWRAACYRVGHAQSTAGTGRVMDQFSVRGLIRHPRRTLAWVVTLRPVTATLRQEFFGAAAT